MMQETYARQFMKWLVYLVAATTAFGILLSMVIAQASTDSTGPDWTSPPYTAVKRVGPPSSPDRRDTPVLFKNMDCTSLTYRLTGEDAMRTGCFTATAFGMMDSDGYTVIFNGTDEGVRLTPYTAHQLLAPWPKAMDMLSLTPLSTGGALLSLYKNPLAAMKDRRDLLGRITTKELTAPPDITLKDSSGRPLVVNPETLAFSDGGGWLVAESLDGAFVRINLATLEVTAFAPSYDDEGSLALLQSRVAVSEEGRFIAIANDYASEFKVYDLSACAGTPAGLRPLNCRSHDYRAFSASKIVGLRSILHLRFINDGILGFEAGSSDRTQAGIYELAPTKDITSLTDYIGLGDSYTSGEGAFDYLAGTDTYDNTCHLSYDSYPLLLARDLFGNGGHSVACSGAVIDDIGSINDGYKGQVRGVATLSQLRQSPQILESIESGFLPGFIPQQRFISRWQPRIVTVSIGGNDIGFGDILQKCVEPHISLHRSANTCYSSYEDRLELKNLIDRTVSGWTALYEELKREDPDGKLYAIGYPQVAMDDGDCGLNVGLNREEIGLANLIIDYLNEDIHKAAEAMGVPYIDISLALKGHRLCEAAGYDVAVNGLTAGNDSGPFGVSVLGRESYHPNALGYGLIEQDILTQTSNFDSASAATAAIGSAPPDTSRLMSAPKTGRTIRTVVPDDAVSPGIIRRGQDFVIHTSGAKDGLAPGKYYAVRLNGPEGRALATFPADDSGNLEGKISVPLETQPGGYTIDVTGENQAGEQLDVTGLVYVAATDADSDGDGIDDIIDSCPYALNSGQDSDGDGIDDTCDGMIGPPGQSDSQPPESTPKESGRRSRTKTVAAASKRYPKNPYGSARNPSRNTERQNSPSANGSSGVLGVKSRPVYMSIAGALHTHSVMPSVMGRPLWRYLPLCAVFLWLLLLAVRKFNKKPVYQLQ